MVIENDGNDRYSYDIYSRLLKDRIIMLTDQVDDQTASSVVAQMLYLQSQDSKKDINFYINSPGGAVTAGLSIISTMNILKCDVATYCLGQCCSMGAVILSAGTKGKRYVLKDSRVMIHSVSSGCEGVIHDMKLSLQEAEKLNNRLCQIIADNCGRSFDDVYKDMNRDFWLSDQEAVDYGIVDKILTKN